MKKRTETIYREKYEEKENVFEAINIFIIGRFNIEGGREVLEAIDAIEWRNRFWPIKILEKKNQTITAWIKQILRRAKSIIRQHRKGDRNKNSLASLFRCIWLKSN